MKKRVLVGVSAILMAAATYLGADALTPSSHFSGLKLSDVEALAEDCEVFNSHHELVVVCRGKEGICWSAQVGGGLLYCPGEKIK